jgi:hypothetical protein
MLIEEKIKNDIKDPETKKIWEEINAAFEEGGSNSVREILDNRAEEFLVSYDAALEELKRLL